MHAGGAGLCGALSPPTSLSQKNASENANRPENELAFSCAACGLPTERTGSALSGGRAIRVVAARGLRRRHAAGAAGAAAAGERPPPASAAAAVPYLLPAAADDTKLPRHGGGGGAEPGLRCHPRHPGYRRHHHSCSTAPSRWSKKRVSVIIFHAQFWCLLGVWCLFGVCLVFVPITRPIV